MDLRTRYLGFDLDHPFVPGASPLCDHVDGCKRLVEAGAPMLTLRSLFEEQLVAEQMAHHSARAEPEESFPEALSYFPDRGDFVLGPEEYLEHVRRVREAVDVPVIGSLNGTTRGGWLGYGRQIEAAGADALELNVYDLPTDPDRSGAEIERETIEMVHELHATITIPVTVKLSPFYTSLPHFAKQLVSAGARGVVLFNRLYQPDIDPERLDLTHELDLSTSAELLTRLRWLAILSGRVPVELAAGGGIHTAEDAVKATMAGARVVQVVSALLEHGAQRLRTLREELAAWLEDHEYDGLLQMRGSMDLERCPDPGAYERANYMQLLQTWGT